MLRAEKYFAEPEERNQQSKLQRIYEVVDQLNGRQVQPKYDRRESAQNRRAAQNGKYAKSDSEGEAQRDLFRSDTLTHEVNDGQDQFAVEKALLHARRVITSDTGSPGLSLNN